MKRRITALAGLCLVALMLLPTWAQNTNNDPWDTDLFALQTGVVEKICLFQNLNAIHHYANSYDAYIRNHEANPNASWIDERYPYPEPGMSCVMGLHEDFGYPVPIKSTDPVCDRQPPFEKPQPPPDGTIKFGDPIPTSYGIPELMGCFNGAGSTVDIGTQVFHIGRLYYFRTYGNGPWVPRLWCPVEE